MMSKQNRTTELELLGCPDVRDNNYRLVAPRYDEIPRERSSYLTDPNRKEYETQLDFDRRVFRALIVGGIGSDKSVPKDGADMLMLLTGTICIVSLGKGINPSSFYLQDYYSAIFGQWELAWPALETSGNKICPTIRQSLERLLVPRCEPGQNDADDSSSCCMASQQLWCGEWFWRDYYPAVWSTSSLVHLSGSITKQGTGIEAFAPEEQESLEVLIEGVKTMQPLIESVLKR